MSCGQQKELEGGSLVIKVILDNNISYNIDCYAVLTILFIGLKVTHNIDWSWWWVFSPIWLPLVVILGVFAVGVVVTLLVALWAHYEEKANL